MTVTVDEVEYLTAATAAQTLCTTELKVLMLLRQKKLSGSLIDGVWHVTAESVASCHPAQSEPVLPSNCGATCGASRCGCK